MGRHKVRSMFSNRTKGNQAVLGFAKVDEAEKVLLDLADYIYAHTSIKPMSKVLFLISRLLLLAKRDLLTNDASALARNYATVRESLNGAAPDDDFSFATVIDECTTHLEYLTTAIDRVETSARDVDALGLAFNTLLRGKFEAGEGLGTFLTPEEVVVPMVDMAIASVEPTLLDQLGRKRGPLFGDICGGTGRFVYAITRRLLERGLNRRKVSLAARLFDQSSFAVDCARLNFLFDDINPCFQRVGDSLTDSHVAELRERFALLATNPPFGTAKYRWHPGLRDSLPSDVLHALGATQEGDTADPSLLFFFRNLDLLAEGGVLAIVLPDGVIHSDKFAEGLRSYERHTAKTIHVAAIVSLPTATFSLGGTVAKTSFLVVRVDRSTCCRPIYFAQANHVGFKKRGKRRVSDSSGNELPSIADEFTSKRYIVGRKLSPWREYKRLSPAALSKARSTRNVPTRPLRNVVASARIVRKQSTDFHVSVLDVDETGLINVVAASQNAPTSPGLACEPGDILLSCINPRIWRVAVIPEIQGSWSCSPEFLVLRPNKPDDAWGIAIALHHADPISAVQAMAGGTSSSRQRVPKADVLDIDIPKIAQVNELAKHALERTRFYETRLKEYAAYCALHNGSNRFGI